MLANIDDDLIYSQNIMSKDFYFSIVLEILKKAMLAFPSSFINLCQH